MNVDSVLQAILLLCSFFNKSESKTIKPLTPTEYSRLAAWLHQNRYTPADFLTQQEELLSRWQDPKNKVTKERLQVLLKRAASMGFALEKWQQQNVWIISRASQDYPGVLRETLGDTRSPILYGIGNKALLKAQGIGFVGSRSINAEDEAFTQSLAQQAVAQGFTVVSGGAKGVDQTSMISALDAGGSAIGILADSLLRAPTNPQYRKALQEGRLLLITPYYPEASFHAGNAMGRNKYIYSLSKGVVVAKSDEKGGTWSGATENLKKQWVPLWVRDLDHPGNQKLIELGGQPLSGDKADYTALQARFSFLAIADKGSSNATPALHAKEPQALKSDIQPDFFSGSLSDDVAGDTELRKSLDLGSEENARELISASDTSGLDSHFETESERKEQNKTTPQITNVVSAGGSNKYLGTFLDIFYAQLQQSKGDVHTPKQLADQYPELTEAMIKQWLKELDNKGLVKRQGKKLAYTLIKE